MTPFKSIRRFAAVALCLALCLLLLPARAAAGDCALTLSFQPGGNPASGVTFQIYRVGQWKGDSIVPLGSLVGKSINWDNRINLATTLAPYLWSLEPTQTGKTGQDGKVTFSNLDAGVYLVMGDAYKTGRYTYTPNSVLISLPSEGKNQVFANVNKYETDYDSPSDRDETSVKVQKVWAGQSEGADRPQSVTVRLLRNGQAAGTVTLNADNNWRHTWSGLDAGSTWEVMETNVSGGYTVSVSKDGSTYTIINTYTPPGTPDNPNSSDNPDNPDNPDTDLPDDDVPKSDQPDTDLPDDDVPQSEYPDADLPDDDVPKSEYPDVDLPDNPDEATLPQTGQLWWPMPPLACGGMVCFLAGWVKNRRDYED